VTTGRSHNRSPSDARWEQGEILSLDSGGNYQGYIGDLCRMAMLGEPDAELVDLLGHVEEIQQTARRPIRPGAIGQSIYDAVKSLVGGSPIVGI
jgi:Xaa-Pro aminopeptidase